MKITLIVAMSESNVIGMGNKMPWHLSEDLKRFKEITMGKPLVMGRKTHESIGRPLPGRWNIVLSRDAGYHANGCTVLSGLDEALRVAKDRNEAEVMIIGGATLYEQTIEHADLIHLTLIQYKFDGDTFFPNIDKDVWTVSDQTEIKTDPANALKYSYITLERSQKGGQLELAAPRANV